MIVLGVRGLIHILVVPNTIIWYIGTATSRETLSVHRVVQNVVIMVDHCHLEMYSNAPNCYSSIARRL